MEWINPRDRLPKHGQVVLGWGYYLDAEYKKGFQLCGIDAEEGWVAWPGLEDLRIFYWMEISGPNNEGETLYQMDGKSGMG